MIKRIYTYLVNDMGFKESNIYIYGRSIGTGPACKVASDYKPAGLFLVSAFTTLKDVANNVGVPKMLHSKLDPQFDNRTAMKSISCQTMFIHGEADPLIPSSHS